MPTEKRDGPSTGPGKNHGPKSFPKAPEPARIAKLLARAGVASRREIERMIEEGRVALNGVTIDTPATLLASLHGVTVDGNPVEEPEPARLFLFHKPAGLLTTERDPAGRPTIYDRLPKGLPRLMPVGRLDLNTEGLLLMTTDGGLKRLLELPATGVERAYRARAYGQVSQPQLEELIHGVEIEGVRYGPIDANIERRTGANLWIEMILKEGKNREVRRVLEHLGLQVSRLIRTRYGPFVLGDLAPGQIGEVRRHDVESFSAEPTRRELPQPARRRAIEPLVAPPADAIPAKDVPEKKKPAPRARPGAPKKEPRRRADGSVASRGGKASSGGARGERARSFRADHAPAEKPSRGPARGPARDPGRDADRSASRSAERPQRSAAPGGRAPAKLDGERSGNASRRSAPSQAGAPRADPYRADLARSGPSRSAPSRPGQSRSGPPRSGSSQSGPSGPGASRSDPSRSGPPRSRSPGSGSPRPGNGRPRGKR
ncbi:pseudouridine synthase [Sphingomonas sp.]|jgi:23S rRNA pseudouridine2605 synthase|uniref:pseudouridine synthase n=1 Tax=Sphingomonas sp. TaxID=28214 RepID=UPI0026269DB6|nr:pseudouridine synthase [Sphingomonas sp.]MDF2494100.1 pseudouridine synthase [Sphingomonas sp.]